MKKLRNFIRSFKRRRREDRIWKDYATAMGFMVCLKFNYPEENFEVVKRDYINPKTTRVALPLRHPDGLFMYYKGLADGLETLLSSRYTNTNIVQSNPPKYVLEFVEL